MSEPAASRPVFTDLWRGVSKLYDSEIQNSKRESQMPGTTKSPLCNDFQSPKGRRCTIFPGLNYGDSPGDAEPSQDIFWDPTSPTAGLKNTRVVEISDIVNRIAPKDLKQRRAEFPLLQWVGENAAVPCTPDIPKSRVRKKSSRQCGVEDLVKLARQFDEKMQQDRECSETFNTLKYSVNEIGNTSKAELRETSFSTSVKDLKCPSSWEAELHALFDCSTQKVSGQLSPASSASASVSACSQEVRDQPDTSCLVEPGKTRPKSGNESGQASRPSEKKEPTGFTANSCEDFDDDWENDDLLNDSFVLAMTQDPPKQLDTNPKTSRHSNLKTNTARFTSLCNPTTANAISVNQPLVHSNPCSSALQELPKPKTNRSTFRLKSNPHFQVEAAAKDPFNFTVKHPKPKISEQKSATTKRLSTPQPDKITNDQMETCVSAGSVQDISETLWDDWDDDALLYQLCDSVERISNTQAQQVSFREKKEVALGKQKNTMPLSIEMAGYVSVNSRANRQSLYAFAGSNSLPRSSSEPVTHRGWNIPMNDANNKSQLPHSLPGRQMGLNTFNHCKESSGMFDNVNIKPHTVIAGAPSKSSQIAIKRNMSDSAVTSNKVFVTSHITGKCSAVEIERKKQEALARRRLRMQNAPKP